MRTLDAVPGRRSRFGIVSLIVLGAVSYANAGVYSTIDPVPGPTPAAGKSEASALPFDVMQISLADRRLLLTALAVAPDARSDEQKKLLEETRNRTTPLAAKVADESATTEDRLNLSAAQISLNQTAEAIGVLQPLTQRYREDPALAGRDPLAPLVHANLAAAYQMNGDPSLAAAQLREALSAWPDELPGFKPERLKWYKKVEKLQYQLLHLREGEQSKTGGKPEGATGVDALFDGVQFVGEDGQYTPGAIAAAQRKKLPPDALAQVQQLVLWLPADDRLYWLYGELLNARGDQAEAFKVLDECVWARRMGTPDLKAHRLALQPPPPAAAAPPEPLSWKFILVGGGGGLAVVFLLYLQLREFARRR
jgi:tetratricopeptide (TPR) repeat protein